MAEKSYDLCIIGGAGRVGLPLGISLADSGANVVLYDINEAALETISSGVLPFMEEGGEEVLKRVVGNTLSVSSKPEVISEAHYVIVIIGTPVDEYLNPKFTDFKRFLRSITEHLRDGQHIILRSTLYPGTTEKINGWVAESGKKISVSFCPERIAEGKAMEELKSLPQIVASFDDASFEDASALFKRLTDEIIRLDPLEAEIAKLCLNSWRYIQFAIANQFYQIATEHDVDFYKVYDAITHNYPRASSFPKAGFSAGPCLLKDTMQIAAYSDNSFFLGHSAMLVNEGLPNFIVKRLKERHGLAGKTVGILGMAFKGNIDDIRDSLSYKLKKILEIEAGSVLCTDPYIEDSSFLELDEVIERSDIIIIGTTHSVYKGLKIAEDKLVVDIWSFFGGSGLF